MLYSAPIYLSRNKRDTRFMFLIIFTAIIAKANLGHGRALFTDVVLNNRIPPIGAKAEDAELLSTVMFSDEANVYTNIRNLKCYVAPKKCSSKASV